MSFPMADAFTRVFPDLVRLVLPQGAIDLDSITPPDDVVLIGTTAKVLVRNDLHPTAIAFGETADCFGNRWLPQTTCASYVAGRSGDLLPLSPPAEKATAAICALRVHCLRSAVSALQHCRQTQNCQCEKYHRVGRHLCQETQSSSPAKGPALRPSGANCGANSQHVDVSSSLCARQ